MMRTTLFILGLFITACHCALSINIPSSLVECQAIQIFWSGGSGDTFLTIDSQSDSGGSADQSNINLGQQTSPFTWSVNVPAGSEVSISVKDDAGGEAQTNEVVNSGSDTSCRGSGSGSIGVTSEPVSSSSPSSATDSSTSLSTTSSPLSAASVTESLTSTEQTSTDSHVQSSSPSISPNVAFSTSSPHATNSASAPSGHPSQHHSDLGKIIGGAVGAVVGTASLLTAVCIWRLRRRKIRGLPKDMNDQHKAMMVATPYQNSALIAARHDPEGAQVSDIATVGSHALTTHQDAGQDARMRLEKEPFCPDAEHVVFLPTMIPTPTPESYTEQSPRRPHSQGEDVNSPLSPTSPSLSDAQTLATPSIDGEGFSRAIPSQSYDIDHLVREVGMLRARMDAAGLCVPFGGTSPPTYRSDLNEEC